MKSFVGMFLFFLLSSASFRAFNPASCGIFGYSPTTSAVTKSALLKVH